MMFPLTRTRRTHVLIILLALLFNFMYVLSHSFHTSYVWTMGACLTVVIIAFLYLLAIDASAEYAFKVINRLRTWVVFVSLGMLIAILSTNPTYGAASVLHGIGFSVAVIIIFVFDIVIDRDKAFFVIFVSIFVAGALKSVYDWTFTDVIDPRLQFLDIRGFSIDKRSAGRSVMTTLIIQTMEGAITMLFGKNINTKFVFIKEGVVAAKLNFPTPEPSTTARATFAAKVLLVNNSFLFFWNLLYNHVFPHTHPVWLRVLCLIHLAAFPLCATAMAYKNLHLVVGRRLLQQTSVWINLFLMFLLMVDSLTASRDKILAPVFGLTICLTVCTATFMDMLPTRLRVPMSLLCLQGAAFCVYNAILTTLLNLDAGTILITLGGVGVPKQSTFRTTNVNLAVFLLEAAYSGLFYSQTPDRLLFVRTAKIRQSHEGIVEEVQLPSPNSTVDLGDHLGTSSANIETCSNTPAVSPPTKRHSSYAFIVRATWSPKLGRKQPTSPLD